MQTIKINPKKLEKTKLILIINLLKKDKVIIFPTDTVYSLAADATSKKAVKKVFQIKKRSPNNPIPIFIKDIRMAKKLAIIDKIQEKFLKTVWPGKITVVLRRRKSKIKLFNVDQKTIALRIPNFKPVNFLLKKLNRPLVGTSANISGKPASGNIKKVLSQFKNQKHQPDLVIDAGNLPKRKPSTVLGLTVSPPKILRS